LLPTEAVALVNCELDGGGRCEFGKRHDSPFATGLLKR
jgi:hypothetical protein